jgi:hypothetical protein
MLLARAVKVCELISAAELQCPATVEDFEMNPMNYFAEAFLSGQYGLRSAGFQLARLLCHSGNGSECLLQMLESSARTECGCRVLCALLFSEAEGTVVDITRVVALLHSFPVYSTLGRLYSVTRSMMLGDALLLFGEDDAVLDDFVRYAGAAPSELTVSIASHLFLRLAQKHVPLPGDAISLLIAFWDFCLSDDLVLGCGEYWHFVPELIPRILAFLYADIVRIHGSESEILDFTDGKQLKARFDVLHTILCAPEVDELMPQYAQFLEQLLELPTVDWVDDTVNLACAVVRLKGNGVCDLLGFIVPQIATVREWCPALGDGIMKIVLTAVCTHHIQIAQWPGGVRLWSH